MEITRSANVNNILYLYTVFDGVQIMPHQSDIHAVFVASIVKKPKDYKQLHTADFIRVSRVRNWYVTERDANDWIERYQIGFVDKTPDGSNNQYWILLNMGFIR